MLILKERLDGEPPNFFCVFGCQQPKVFVNATVNIADQEQAQSILSDMQV
jgi:hypothetical protein